MQQLQQSSWPPPLSRSLGVTGEKEARRWLSDLPRSLRSEAAGAASSGIGFVAASRLLSLLMLREKLPFQWHSVLPLRLPIYVILPTAAAFFSGLSPLPTSPLPTSPLPTAATATTTATIAFPAAAAAMVLLLLLCG